MSRGFPSMTALLGLLAVAGYQNRDKIAEMLQGLGGQAPAGAAPGGVSQGSVPQGGMSGGTFGGQMSGQTTQPSGGFLSGLGGLLGGASAGTLVNGGLGELVDRFRQSGQGQVADSWIGHGPNQEITPDTLRQTIGEDTLNTLAQQTGLSHDELLQRLSTTLPTAVDRYTPNGRVEG